MKYFLDLEFTPADEYQECLSIGVVKRSRDGQLVDTFYRIIRPIRHIRWGYKGFTKEMMQTAIPFAQMCRELKQWLDRKSMIYCYSDKDIEQFKLDCRRARFAYFLEGRLFDLQPVIMHDLHLRYRPSLEAVKKQLGFEHPKVLHHALVDACDLMLVYNHLHPQKEALTTNPFYETYALLHQPKPKPASTPKASPKQPKKKPIQYPPMCLTKPVTPPPFPFLRVQPSVLTERIQYWNTSGVFDSSGQRISDQQPTTLPSTDLFYQASIRFGAKGLVTITYEMNQQVILKAHAKRRLAKHIEPADLAQYEMTYEIRTPESEWLIQTGFIGWHLWFSPRQSRYQLLKHPLNQSQNLWLFLSIRAESPTIQPTHLPILTPIHLVIQPFYSERQDMPTHLKLVWMNPTWNNILTVQNWELSSDEEEAKLRLDLLQQCLSRYFKLHCFCLEAKRLRTNLATLNAVSLKFVDLTIMEERILQRLNIKASTETERLRHLQSVLKFPQTTQTPVGQTLETYLHLIRYSKGLLTTADTPLLLDNLTPMIRPLIGDTHALEEFFTPV